MSDPNRKIDDERGITPDLQEITEEDLHREDEQRNKQDVAEIIGSMTHDEFEKWLYRNQIEDTLNIKPKIKPKIGNA